MRLRRESARWRNIFVRATPSVDGVSAVRGGIPDDSYSEFGKFYRNYFRYYKAPGAGGVQKNLFF